MAKSKTPFKRHPLPRPGKQEWVPPKDKAEGTDVRRRGYFPGSNYTSDELEWIMAVETFQRKEKRKFLSHVDYQRIALSLGYTKVPPPPVKRAKKAVKPLGPTLFDKLKD